MLYMYHSFLVHSSADGHLGCFQKCRVLTTWPPGKSLAVFLLRPQAVLFCMQSAKDHTEEFVVKLQTLSLWFQPWVHLRLAVTVGCFFTCKEDTGKGPTSQASKGKYSNITWYRKTHVCSGSDHHHHDHHCWRRFHSSAFVPQTSPGRKGLESLYGLSLAFFPLAVQLTKALAVAVSKRTVPLIQTKRKLHWPLTRKKLQKNCSR